MAAEIVGKAGLERRHRRTGRRRGPGARREHGPALRTVAAAVLLQVALVGAAQAPPLGSFGAGARFDPLILQYSRRAGVSPRLVKALIMTESEFESHAVSPSGARGLMQLMPETAEELGVLAGALDQPEPNIRAGTAYLDRLFQSARLRYGLKEERLRDTPSWVQRRVLAGYNGGPRLMFDYDWPEQTRLYVRRVMQLSRSRAAIVGGI